jgi:catechol 2,3-dioxygenase-like lactoylglutathione lyase family enzyme
MIERISAVTLVTRDMGSAVRFYRALGFSMRYGGEAASFTSFAVGSGYLNLVSAPTGAPQGWGRVVFYVSDVDELHARALTGGLTPATEPRDAEWGERFFHILDPDGHELSFAKPLRALG